MSKIESSREHLAELETRCVAGWTGESVVFNRPAMLRLIEARDNAVRAALLKEITVLANQHFEGRTLYHDALEAAFDEVHDKYTQPKEPTSG